MVVLARARGIPAVAVAIAVIHVVLATRYGLHRDELYLLQVGQHAFDGSLDHSIATPLISRATQAVLSDSAVALRIVPALLGGGLVVAAASLCRRLGGDPWAQWIAAGIVASSPVFIYTAGVFSTTAIDQLVGAMLSLGAVALATSNADPRWWLAMGVIGGVGLANKLTTALVACSLGVGLAMTPGRKWRRTAWPYLAVAIAAAFTIPDLVLAPDGPGTWFGMLGRHYAGRLRYVALADFGLGQLADLHVVGLIAVACAIARARRDAGTRLVVVSWLVAGVVLLVAHGKHYYWAPWYVGVIAAGAIPIAGWLRERRAATRLALVTLFVASTLVAWVATLPLLSAVTSHAVGLDAVHRELVQFADWERLVRDLAELRDHAGLPQDTPIVTDSYGTAAAVERYGPAYGVPPPISGANSYHVWTRALPARWKIAREATVVMWIGYPDAVRAARCREQAAIGTLRQGEASNRYDFPRVVYRCELRAPLADAWEELRAFD